MKLAVDRLEGELAVCVADADGREVVFTLPAALFPTPPREGDIYELSLTPDEAEREARDTRIKNKLIKLFNRIDRGEDFK